VKPHAKVPARKLAALMYAPINPSVHDEYNWPSFDDVMKSQEDSEVEPPLRFKRIYGVFKDEDQVV